MKTNTDPSNTPQKKAKVALGMSGGVDSSLSAHLLIEQGYEVTGVFLECWRAPGCRSEEDRKDALAVALELGIPFTVLDFKDAYKQKVVESFYAEYAAGSTPNPDVLCNKEIKFGLFYDWALTEGFDFVATGHYAKITGQDATTKLVIPADTHKDQTYFLYLLKQTHLQHTLFPLGDLTKTAVRAEAKNRQITVADKKDSVGICFIGDINVHNFLKERLGENPGEVVDTKGNVIGNHKGLWFYTIGQRTGFHVDHKSVLHQQDGSKITKENIPPFYVIKKNPANNQLVVGFGAETLLAAFTVTNISWINQKPENNTDLYVRIRHTGSLLACTLSDTNVVTLAEATQGIAEGQAAVFYQKSLDNMVCLGGGTII